MRKIYKFRIKKSIKGERNWGSKYIGEIIEVDSCDEDNELKIGRNSKFNIDMGASIPFKHLELIDVDKKPSCCCKCCCNCCE